MGNPKQVRSQEPEELLTCDAFILLAQLRKNANQ